MESIYAAELRLKAAKPRSKALKRVKGSKAAELRSKAAKLRSKVRLIKYPLYPQDPHDY